MGRRPVGGWQRATPPPSTAGVWGPFLLPLHDCWLPDRRPRCLMMMWPNEKPWNWPGIVGRDTAADLETRRGGGDGEWGGSGGGERRGNRGSEGRGSARDRVPLRYQFPPHPEVLAPRAGAGEVLGLAGIISWAHRHRRGQRYLSAPLPMSVGAAGALAGLVGVLYFRKHAD